MHDSSATACKVVLVLGTHPGDAEIGMGGTISRMAAAGNDVYVCIAVIPEDRDRWMQKAREAGRIMGARDVIFMPLTERDFGYNRTTIAAMEQVVRQLAPHSIFTHWINDTHQDHANLSRNVMAATRKHHFNVLMYEQTIPGGTSPASFAAHYLIDISGFIEEKMASVCTHASRILHNGVVAWRHP